MGIIWRWKLTLDQVNMKNVYFRYFWWFLTSALTLRLRNTYLYIFETVFCWYNFEATSCKFWKSEKYWLSSTLIFGEKKSDCWCMHVVLCCCAGNQYTEINGIIFEISNQRLRFAVNKSENSGENTFNGDHFEMKANHGSSKDKNNVCFS